MCSCSVGEGGRDRAQWPFLMAWGQPPRIPLMELPRGWGSPHGQRSQMPRAEPPGIHGSFLGSAWTAGGGQRGRGVEMEPPRPGWARGSCSPSWRRPGAGSGGVAASRGCLLQAPAPSSRRSPEGGNRQQDCPACASACLRPAPAGSGAVPPARLRKRRSARAAGLQGRGRGPGPASSPRRGRSSGTQWLGLSSAPGFRGSPSPLLPWFSSAGFQAFIFNFHSWMEGLHSLGSLGCWRGSAEVCRPPT